MTTFIQSFTGVKRRASAALFSAPATILILLVCVFVAGLEVPTHTSLPSKPDGMLLFSDNLDGSGGGIDAPSSSPDNGSGTSALAWFSPSSSAEYAILHYVIPGQAQRNVALSYDNSAGRWGFTVNGLSSGQTMSYSYTYDVSGLQYDTRTYSWTVP